MCGIVGAIGPMDYKPFLTGGLRKLDYRGYDSSGLAFWNDGKISLYRALGSVDNLASIVPDRHPGSAGIAHTRWATHGGVSVENAHPQRSWDKKVYLVHNGVIDNFEELRAWLRERDFSFRSDTDTEIIASLIAYYLSEGERPLTAIKKTMERLDGSYALAILFSGIPGLYFAKNKSPLVIGLGIERINCLASDYAPLMDVCSDFTAPEDGTYGLLTGNAVFAFRGGKNIPLSFEPRNREDYTFDLEGYPHFMLKEIAEGPKVIRHAVSANFDAKTGYLFEQSIISSLRAADEIVLLGCGSSHYAAEAGAAYLNRSGFRAVSYIASEWIHGLYPRSRKPVYVLISQSGETADLISCLDLIDGEGRSVAIVNAKDSTIARRSDHVIYIGAGLEVAVASTKSFLGQLAILMLLAGALRHDDAVPLKLLDAATSVEEVIRRKSEIDTLASECYTARDAFFVGRGMDYFASEESSLKLKEIAYVHSEAYPGGELKHGPIALIEEGVPVFAFIGNPELGKALRSNVQEMMARGAASYIVSSSSSAREGDGFVYPAVDPSFAVFPEVAFGQLLAYSLSLRRGLNVDKPRNLAKSVTVN